MKNTMYTYTQLIALGFVREEMNDNVLFDQTGYSGYCLTLEFEGLGMGISTTCPASASTWTFNHYDIRTGNVLGEISPHLLEEVINSSITASGRSTVVAS